MIKVSSIAEFKERLDGQQMAIVSFLHTHLESYHDLSSKINWNIPAYYRKSWICYLNPIKGNGIELAFFRGRELSNEQGILLRKERKLVAGIDYFSVEGINLTVVNEIVQEAIILDDLARK